MKHCTFGVISSLLFKGRLFFPGKHEGQFATLSDIFLLPLFTRAFQTAKVSSLSTPTPLASLLFTSYRIFPWKHLGNHSFIVKYLHLEPNSIMYFIEKSNKEDLVLWNAVLLASSTPCSTKEGFFSVKTRGAICYLKGHLLTPALYPRISNSHDFKCFYSHTLGITLLDLVDDFSVKTLGEWFIHCKITPKEALFSVKTRRSFYSYTMGISFIHFLQDFSVKTLGEWLVHCKITTFISLISQIEKN